MVQITDEMSEAINNASAYKTLCILATSSPNGEPNVAFKGSMRVLDNDSLAYLEVSKRRTLENIEESHKVVVMFREPEGKLGWRFYGEAREYHDGPIAEQVAAKMGESMMERLRERQPIAVVIKLDRITDARGNDLP